MGSSVGARSRRISRALLVGIAALVALTGSGGSCSEQARTPTVTPPPVAEVADARLARRDLRLVVLTDLKGYLEPCGCTSRPLGGIDRLAARMTSLRAEGVPTLFVAAGDLFFDGLSLGVDSPEAATQEIWKAETVADVLSGLELAAVAPGPLDFSQGAPLFEALRGRARFPLLAAGVSYPGAAEGERRTLDGHVIREVGGRRVGIVGVSELGPTLPQGVEAPDDLVQASSAAVAAARAEGAEIVVLLARGTRRTVRRLAQGAGADFVVHGGLDEAEAHTPAIAGGVILHAGRQGQGIVVVDVQLGAQGDWVDASAWTRRVERDRVEGQAQELRGRIAEWERDPTATPADVEVQRTRLRELEAEMAALTRAPDAAGRAFSARYVELPQDAERDASVRALLEAHDRRVNEHNRTAFASLTPRPAAEGQPHYVGSEACGGECHAEELVWWRTTLHGHAYRTLQDRHKEYNLSCVGCHVTGYNQPGGSTVAHVGPLADVGCENCHGPGSQHVESPTAAAVDVRLDATEDVCLRCHTPEHSDHFDYTIYRRMMITPVHGGGGT